jgi:hypothetical protein
MKQLVKHIVADIAKVNLYEHPIENEDIIVAMEEETGHTLLLTVTSIGKFRWLEVNAPKTPVLKSNNTEESAISERINDNYNVYTLKNIVEIATLAEKLGIDLT